jgi:hypothetical protein
MTLYLEDANSFDRVRLWNGQRFDRSVDANTEIFAPAVISDTIVSALSSEGQFAIDGITTGEQRIDLGTTSRTDPTAAVAEWVAELEAYVNDQPANSGYQLRNDYTGESENVTPEGISWTRTEGAYQSVEYTVDLELGGDTSGDLGIDPATPTPSDDDFFDRVRLPNVYERRVDKSLELEVLSELLAGSASDNDVIQTSGATKRVTLLGRYEGSWSEMRSFDGELTSRAGDRNSYLSESAFPGGEFEAAILAYESTREAGVTQQGEYVLELVAGSVV